MESLAVFVDEEWDNLSRMFSSEEEYSDQHFALQLHGNGIFSGERGHDMMINIETPSSFWPSTDHESSNANAPIFDEGLFLNYYFSQETSTHSSDTSTNTNLSLPTPTHGDGNYHHADSSLITHHLTPNHSFSDHRSMDFYTMDDNNNNNNMLSQVFSDDVMEEILCLKQTNVEKAKMEHSDSQQMATADPAREMQLKRKFEMRDHELPEATKDDVVKIDPVDKNPKKKQRVVSKDNKTKKNAQSKKNGQKLASETDGNDGEVETNNGGAGNGQTSSSCSSEDDSNSNSNESNGGALNLNGKTRAGRGAATDPQSLYARKRRERINERLRILQNLVPNGTKVDISTMLEEAVHYVKFLQLQIKLLSSDDMWMYAPIAYNGMDMGLYQKISSSTQ